MIVLSDGESDNPTRVHQVLKNLRDKGVVVAGVGITESAAAIKKTYAPEALICGQAASLAVTLAELLKDYLTRE